MTTHMAFLGGVLTGVFLSAIALVVIDAVLQRRQQKRMKTAMDRGAGRLSKEG